MARRGIFITFEGIEGSGKTTQAEHLATVLGPDVVLTREPGGTPISERIRDIFLASDDITPMTELLLIAAARTQHVDELIRPALDANRTVICDRFIDATVAYQGYRGGIDLSFIHQLNHIATGGLTPDITFILDLSSGDRDFTSTTRRDGSRPSGQRIVGISPKGSRGIPIRREGEPTSHQSDRRYTAARCYSHRGLS